MCGSREDRFEANFLGAIEQQHLVPIHSLATGSALRCGRHLEDLRNHLWALGAWVIASPFRPQGNVTLGGFLPAFD